MKKMLHEFVAPGVAWRGKPFWSWNGTLTADELRKQIRHMHRMGLGGFFMHSRVGLNTPYLSEEWFKCVEVCIDEAERLDMEAWLYDEDRWPSGAAGGLVTKNPKYRMRRLQVNTSPDAKAFRWKTSILAVFVASIDGRNATDVQRIARGRKPTMKKGQTLIVFEEVTRSPSSWFNGQTYLDTMNHEAVQEFIKVTHEAYLKNCGKHFGKRVPGIFTDEPNHSPALGWWEKSGVLSLPWTSALPAIFKGRYGYDLIPRLMELIYVVDGNEVSQARYHYHECKTFLFVDAFSRQIGEWCEKHNLEFTGHVLLEETLSGQTQEVGSAMRFYEYMHAPGMDILTEHIRGYDTAKQVSSVARQFGRKWRLTETYGCTGWDFSFAGHKAIGDWQAALGINNRCQHLSWYTMLGEAKRDFPASIFYQSPWWEMYSKVEDYFARINLAMTQGEEVRDLLVVHPVESMWLKVGLGWNKDPDAHAMDHALQKVRDSLLAANIDYDYGEEEILSKWGKVGKKDGAPVLRVNKAAYKTVIVPSMTTIRSTTLSLLKRFKKAGGEVIFEGSVPTHVDALPSDEVNAFAVTCIQTQVGRLAEAANNARRIHILDEAGQEIQPALHLLREDKNAYYLFVCNTGHTWEKKPEIMVRDRTLSFDEVRIVGFADCVGHPVELNPDTGEKTMAEAQRTDEGWTIRTSFPVLGSRIFILPKKEDVSAPKAVQLEVSKRTTLRKPKWQITRSEANVLVLDRSAARINGEETGIDEILRIDRKTRDVLGIPYRGGEMVQPWVTRDQGATDTASIPVELTYTFNIKAIPSGACSLALEVPERYQIHLNRLPLDPDSENGWWVDRSLRTIPVDTARLRIGRNSVTLLTDYSAAHPGLEIIYLLGDFGVQLKKTEATLVAPPQTLKTGDWVTQGLPFYSGNLAYRAKINVKREENERVFVQVSSYKGVAVRVLVDSVVAGIIAWEPNELEITDYLSGESVEIVIEIAGHRRNSHGPLHHAEKWPVWTGPDEFLSEGKKWVDHYNLVPCGLMDAPVIVCKREKPILP